MKLFILLLQVSNFRARHLELLLNHNIRLSGIIDGVTVHLRHLSGEDEHGIILTTQDDLHGLDFILSHAQLKFTLSKHLFEFILFIHQLRLIVSHLVDPRLKALQFHRVDLHFLSESSCLILQLYDCLHLLPILVVARRHLSKQRISITVVSLVFLVEQRHHLIQGGIFTPQELRDFGMLLTLKIILLRVVRMLIRDHGVHALHMCQSLLQQQSQFVVRLH